jgi:hypothetical protein
MHDMMDHAKIASLVFSHKTKQLDGLMKLPVSVIGMFAHGLEMFATFIMALIFLHMT